MMKIGMLTSGGDCQALNAAMRGVVKGLTTNVDELEIYGFENGYKGLIYEQYRILTASDFSGILTRGGTILGSSRQPFKQMRVPDENGLEEWNQNMESLLGNTGANISEAVTLEVEQTLSGSTKKGTETVYPTLAKMGDNWYIMETDNEKLQNPAGQSDSSSQS